MSNDHKLGKRCVVWIGFKTGVTAWYFESLLRLVYVYVLRLYQVVHIKAGCTRQLAPFFCKNVFQLLCIVFSDAYRKICRIFRKTKSELMSGRGCNEMRLTNQNSFSFQVISQLLEFISLHIIPYVLTRIRVSQEVIWWDCAVDCPHVF